MPRLSTDGGPGRTVESAKGGKGLWARLLALDGNLTERLRLPPGPERALALFVAHSGDSPLWLAVGGAAWLWGNPSIKVLGIRVLVANLAGAAAATLLKWTFRRRRPGPAFAALYTRLDRMSFPSGHATRLGCMVVLLAPLVPGWGTAALAVWACAVAWARVALGVHYLSDVLAGLIFGLVLGGLGRAVPWG